jgi:hypothetical protein
MRYKEYIHNFLQRSLMIYMRYNDEIKKIINEYSNNLASSENNLGEIQEEESEYNIYSERSSDSSKTVSENNKPIETKQNQSHSKHSYKKINSSTNNNKILSKQNSMKSKTGFSKQHSFNNTNNCETFNHSEFEVDKHISRIKNELYFKFCMKIERILNFFSDKNITFENIPQSENPLNLLKKLTEIKEVGDRNEIIEKLENSVSKFIKL